MPYLVILDDELVEALKEKAEPLVDSIDSVLRRELGLAPVAQSPLFFQIERVAADGNERTGAIALASAPPQPRAPRRRRKGGKTRGGSQRAPKGSLLDERAYWTPILEALADAPNGAAAARDVIAKVGVALDEQLTQLDREQVASGGERWQGRVQFARLRMKDAGLLETNSPRGVWQISNEGRSALEKARLDAA